MAASDPADLGLVGTASTGGTALGLDVAGDLACLVSGNLGLATIDVSDPGNPVILAQIAAGDAVRVQIDGDFAYVADRDGGARDFDIRDPAQPIQLAQVATGDETTALVPRGRHLLMCDGSAGLTTLRGAEELTDLFPHSGPTLNENVNDVALDGTVAYLAVDDLGLVTVDFSDPRQPQLLDNLPGANYRTVAVSGDIAVAGGNFKLVIVDVSDPAALNQVGALPGAQDVVLDGRFAFVVNNGLSTYDISDPASPILLDSYDSSIFFGILLAKDSDLLAAVSIYDGYSVQGLATFDVGDPSEIQYLAMDLNLIPPDDLLMRGSMIYAAASFGLGVFEIDPDTGFPDLVATEASASYLTIAGSGDRIYAGGDDGIQIYDISDPVAPVTLQLITRPVRSLALAGDHLLYADHSGASFSLFEIMQRRFDRAADRAQSIPLYAGEAAPITVRLATIPSSPDVVWALDTGRSSGWQTVPANASTWTELVDTDGDELRWRATLEYAGGGVAPTCSQLDLQWRYTSAMITSVEDVPNDQGGQVRLRWLRGGYDDTGLSTMATEYAIYRLIDDPARRAAAEAGDDPAGDRAYPPGDWDYLLSVPAALEEDYAVIVTTLGDSTVSGGLHESTFFVRTFTDLPGAIFDSPTESGYSVDNLSPAPPANPVLDGSLLSWDEPSEADFDDVTIYGSQSGEMDGTETVIGYTSATSFELEGVAHP